jgi:hypothetical protein
MNIGAESLKNAGCIGILKGKAELYSQESETHVPDLPEG